MTWRRFLSAGAGGMAAQAVNLAALPVLTRIFSRDDLGHWALWLGGALIVGSVATLRLELAVVTAKEPAEASTLLWVSLACAACGAGGLVLLTMLPQVRGWLGAAEVPWLAPLAGLMAFGLSVQLALQAWLTRLGRFMEQSIAQAGLAILGVGIQIGMGFGLLAPSAPPVLALVLGSLAGQGLACVVLVGACLPRARRPAAPSRPGAAVRAHRRFPCFSAPYTLFGVLRDRAGLMIFQAYLTPAQVGQYAFAWRALNFPVGLISGSLRPVIFHDGARHGITEIGPLVTKLMTLLGLATGIGMAVFLAMPGDWFALILGPSWRDTGPMGAVMIWGIGSFVLANWLDRVMDLLGRQGLTLTMEIIFTCLSLGGMLGVFMAGGSMLQAVVAQAVALTLYNVVYLVAVYRCAQWPVRELLLALMPGAAAGTCALAAMHVGILMVGPWIALLLVGSLVAVLLWSFRRRISCG